ncbi:MAG: urease accessory protein UreD [Pseudomonadota bacterium]
MNVRANVDVQQSADQPSTGSRRWPASLKLSFANGEAGTELSKMEHRGPLRVQRLFHPPPGQCAHCYILHPPGGVVLGDELAIEAATVSGEALLTSTSAARFYGTGSFTEPQRQSVRLKAEGGVLQWLPQEAILFNGSNAKLDTSIEIGRGAHLVYWDVLVLGMPACGSSFDGGQVEQTLSVRSTNGMLLKERLALRSGDRLASGALGIAKASTVGTFVSNLPLDRSERERWLAEVKKLDSSGLFSITVKGELLIARYRGDDAFLCRQGFSILWQTAWCATFGEHPAEPRIWHT